MATFFRMIVKMLAFRFSVAGSNSTSKELPSGAKGSSAAAISTDRPSYVKAIPPRDLAECCSLNFWKIARSLDAGCKEDTKPYVTEMTYSVTLTGTKTKSEQVFANEKGHFGLNCYTCTPAATDHRQRAEWYVRFQLNDATLAYDTRLLEVFKTKPLDSCRTLPRMHWTPPTKVLNIPS